MQQSRARSFREALVSSGNAANPCAYCLRARKAESLEVSTSLAGELILASGLLRLGAFGVLRCLRRLRVGRLYYRGGAWAQPAANTPTSMASSWSALANSAAGESAQERSPVSMILELRDSLQKVPPRLLHGGSAS